MMNGKIISYLKSACSQPKCVSSQTRFSGQAPCALDPISASKIGEESRTCKNNCKNGNDIAGQSIDIEWHVCFGDTSVQILCMLQI